MGTGKTNYFEGSVCRSFTFFNHAVPNPVQSLPERVSLPVSTPSGDIT